LSEPDHQPESFKDKLETWVIYALIAIMALPLFASLVWSVAKLFRLF
jgi:hypothetical protein